MFGLSKDEAVSAGPHDPTPEMSQFRLITAYHGLQMSSD